MKIIEWAEERFRRFTVWDIGVFKTALVVFGLIIGAYVADFVKQYVWYLGALFVLLYAYLVYRMLR